MVGKFVFGMLSGGALVAGGFIIGSAMAPVQTPPAANDSAPVAAEAPAAPAAETAAATPEVAPEAAPEVTPEEPAQVASAEAEPEVAADAPEADAVTEEVVEDVAEAPAAEAAEPSLPAAEAEAETATVNESLPAPDPVEVEPAAPEAATAEATEAAPEEATADGSTVPAAEAPAAATAEPAAETAATEAATADAATTETVAEAPAVPEAPEAPEAAASAEAPADTAVAEVAPPALPLAPPPLLQLSTDGVLSALDRSASEAAPVVVAEAAPEPAPVAEPAPEAAAQPAAEPAPEPATEPVPEPEPLPEVAEADPPAVEPPVVDDGMTAPPLDDNATARLPGTAAPSMPGNRPATLPGTGAAAGDEVVPEAEVAVMPEAAADGPTFVPAPGAEDAAEAVVVNRLPRIGDAPAEAEAAAEADPATPADSRPIAIHAASFENPDAKPVLAIVLIDNGNGELDRAGLAALPFPVTFALDPMDPSTPDHAAIYRAAGKEVVMLATGIADGAQASDVEVAFQSMEQGLPEAVAVMDLAEAAFQNRRPLASLVVPVVGAQGRGLLTWDQGLNAADQVARREDIPAAVIFRDLTSAGTDGAAIRRVLDRAVFKAGQDGRVTVAANATPETVATLLEWTVEGRAATVAIGPLTAVMTVE